MSRIDEILSKVQDRIEAADLAREQALVVSRRAIRLSAQAIRTAHRGELAEAGKVLSQAREQVQQLHALAAEHPQVVDPGFLHDAEKEFVEAAMTISVVEGKPEPSPEELAVGDAAYLNGLAEAIGEVRRQIVDRLRAGEVTRSSELLEVMDDFYSGIVSFDYPDALLRGLRRRTDVARSVIERTRYDVTTAMRQEKLEKAMRELESVLNSNRKTEERKG